MGGTTLHSKAYFPGYYCTGDVNSVGNGMWPLYDEDKTLQKGQLNDSFLANSTMDRYIGYQKEKVRQTILKHELVFKDQLQELHRLYKRQRELMNEFGRRELHKHLLPAETSKPRLNIPPTPFEDATQVSDSFMMKSKSTCSKLLSHDRTHLKNYESVNPEYKFKRKLFDLELPAEVYMNDEEKQTICGVERIERFPLEKNKQSLSYLDMNLCPGSFLNSQSNEHALKFMLDTKRNHKLADLNEPWVEETSTRDPLRNVGVSVHLREDIKERDIFGSLDSRSQCQPEELYQRFLGEKDGRKVLRTIQSDSVENENGQLTYNSKAGQTRFHDHTSLGNISDEHPSTLFSTMQVDRRKNLSLCDRSNAASQRMKAIFGVEISDRNQNTSTNTCKSPSSQTLIQQTDAVDSEPSCIAAMRMTCTLAQNVVSSPEYPDHHTSSHFTGRPSNSVVQMPDFSGDKSINNLRSIPRSRFEASNLSALCFGSQSSVVQHGYLDLNSYVAAANKLQNKVVSQQDSVLADAKLHSSDKQIKSREVTYQMSLDSLKNCSQHFFNKAEIAEGPFKDFTSSTSGSDSGRKIVDVCHSRSSSKLYGIPILDVPQISEVLVSPNCPSKPTHNASRLECDGLSKHTVHNIESVNQLEEKCSVADNGPSNSFSGLTHQIDLNLTPNEEETPSTPSVPIAVMKVASTDIDLEAPAVLESVTDVLSEAGHLEKNNEKFSKVSLDDSCENNEELSKVAAEAIINLSLSQLDVIDPSCQMPVVFPPDCLLWLADVISSYEGGAHEGKVTKSSTNHVDDASCEDSVPQGVDYFEFMTLKLQDTKVEEYLYPPYVLDDCNDKDARATSVAKRGRKGQARRKRQMDFQRDVLPSLVSLSRCEVREDLQTIEEIFKAAGETWQSSSSQRRASRNGRGRKHLAPSETATAVCAPPVQQPPCRDMEGEDRNLTGWGKRTRRLPRQRCLIGNHAATLNC